MLRRLCAVVVGVIVSGFAFLLLTGRYLNDGPVLARLAEDRGVHLGDVFVVAGWVVALAMLVVLAGPYRRGARGAADPDGVRPSSVLVGGGARPARRR